VRSLQRLEFVAEPLSRILVAELTGFTVIGAIGLQAYLLHLPYSLARTLAPELRRPCSYIM
jgi:hypothetical protein